MSERTRRVAVISLVDKHASGWNGFTEKISQIVSVASAEARVDLYCCTGPVFKVEQNVTVCLERCVRTSQWRAYTRTCLRLLTGRYHVAVIPTLFHPALPFLFVAARLGGSTIIYRMADAIRDTVVRMPTMTRARVRLRVLARLIPHLAGVAEWVVLRLSDHILTQSPSLVAEVTRKTRARVRVHLAYNYVPSPVEYPDKLEPELEEMLNAGATVCMYFGHAQPDIRGLERVISAMRHTRNDVRLVLLGSRQGGDYFERLVQDEGVGDRVAFLPAKRKPLALGYLSRAHYCIIPPHPAYVIPAKIFDAGTTGVPLILPCTMTDAVNLFGNTSLLYDPDDTSSLVEALDRAHQEREARRKAAQKAASDLCIPTFADAVRQVFQEIRERDP